MHSKDLKKNNTHILIIDDDEKIRLLLKKFLENNDFKVSDVENTDQAKKIMGSLIFDLLVIDIMMPGQNGLDFLKEIRQTNSIPTLMLTAMSSPEDRLDGLEYGADDYLPKPCNLTLLRARLGASLDKKFRYDDDLALYQHLKDTQSSVRTQLIAARKLASELSASEDNEVTLERLRRHFASMSSLLLEKDSALHETIKKLEVKISRQSVASQVKAITSDPAFQTLSERARMMRERRQQRGA